MPKLSKLFIIFTGILLLIFTNIKTIYAQNSKVSNDNPDSTLFTLYNLNPFGQIVWSVCGELKQTTGCYSGGQFGPFTKVGSMMEGEAAVDGNVVTRAIYVVDSGASNAILYIYKKVDTINQPSDEKTTVTLTNTIPLPLVGGKDAQTFMAANSHYLYIGTNLSQEAMAVNKETLEVTSTGGFIPPLNITSINANQYGYVSINSADPNDKTMTGFFVFNPEGVEKQDGGGANFVLSATQGITPSPINYGVGQKTKQPRFHSNNRVTQKPVSHN